MASNKKTKLCWNCDGVVERSAENCIFCGVYLHPNQEEIEEYQEEMAHTPPYRPKEEAPTKTDPAPYKMTNEVLKEELQITLEENGVRNIRGVLFPLIFLFVGSIFCLFSIILLLFSKNGLLVLKWDATYWFVYLAISLPLLFIGWRTLKYFDEPT